MGSISRVIGTLNGVTLIITLLITDLLSPLSRQEVGLNTLTDRVNGHEDQAGEEASNQLRKQTNNEKQTNKTNKQTEQAGLPNQNKRPPGHRS